MNWNLWEAVIRIAVSLPIICLAAYLFIKYGLARSHPTNYGNLRVVEQIKLTPKASISIVRIEDQYLLVSATDSQVSVLKEMDDYQPPEPRSLHLPTNLPYRNGLTRFLAGRGKRNEP